MAPGEEGIGVVGVVVPRGVAWRTIERVPRGAY